MLSLAELENRICRQIQDLHASFGIKERRNHEVAHTLPTPGGWNWAHFCSTICLWAAVSEILADFLNFHIWAWNLEFEERSQSCISTLFLPQRVKIVLIFALRAAVFEIRANFQNFNIWAWNLEFEERFQHCICTPFLPQGVEIKLIFTLQAAVFEIRGDSQNFNMADGHEIWNLKKGPKVHMYSLSTPGGQN